MFTNIAALSYSIAALAFLTLSVLLLTSWRGRLHGTVLTIVSLLTCVWAATVAYQSLLGHPISLSTNLLEVLRNAGWSILLLTLLGHFHQPAPFSFSRIPRLAFVVIASYFVILAATISSYWMDELPFVIRILTSVMGRIALAVVGMLLIEQLYRNTPTKERWSIKFACFGIGGLFAYDFYLYSDALLFRQMNGEIWAARGVVNALTVPLIAISASRNPKWSLGIAVSRRVLFHSAALFGSAIYLLAMAAAGYYLRFFGGSWGTLMQVAFLFGAVILLAGVLLSGAFRSKLKVFISKHFYNYNYDYREEWLRFTRTLSVVGPDLGERTVQALADLVESPGGALFIRKEQDNYELAAHLNMALTGTSEQAASSFCEYLETKQWVIDLQEYENKPEKYDTITIPAWLQNTGKAWLVIPLILQGKLFGFVVLSHSRSRIQLNWEVIDLLKIAGSQAASYLSQHESANALMVARQFESFNRMSTFMVHDLKNLISQLSLLLSNAEKHKNNPEFQKDMFETLDFSVQKMKLLLQKLGRGASAETPAALDIDKLLQQAVALKSAVEPKPVLEIMNPGLKVVANGERLERVIGHIVQNAVEATPRDGKVTVRLYQQEKNAVIEVKDTGQGMSEEFIRERLYKPFESTKSAGMGIGVFESREYITELGGQLEVTSEPRKGTTFCIRLPLHSNVVHTIETVE
ncbi:MAG: XrtA/PEP-CTERM system histidine kinase PrsK [Burkholderiaceae bacterium]